MTVMTFLSRNTSGAPTDEHAASRLPVLSRAPELVGVYPWFNTPEFAFERSVQNAERAVREQGVDPAADRAS